MHINLAAVLETANGSDTRLRTRLRAAQLRMKRCELVVRALQMFAGSDIVRSELQHVGRYYLLLTMLACVRGSSLSHRHSINGRALIESLSSILMRGARTLITHAYQWYSA